MGAIVAGGLTGLLNQSSAQVVDGSLKFIRNSVTSLKRTPGSAGNRKTWTWSGWIKRDTIDTAQFFFGAGPDGSNDTNQIQIFFEADNQIRINTGNSVYLETTQVFRDTGWYHFVVATDTTLSTANDRVKLYVNGSQVTAFDTRNNPTENSDTGVNSATEHKLGESTGSTYAGSSYTFDGRMSQVYLIDGQALGPGYFGFTDPLTNTWRPRKFRAEGTTINDGTVWSSKVTGANNPANAFDGSLSSNMDNNGSAGTPIVLTATFKNVTSFKYYTSNSSAHDVTFNGATTIRDAAASGWRTIDNPPSTITSISWIHSSQPGSYVIVEAIEINGEILRDNTTTNLSFGTNGFYLPMDGNSPIGKDQSGKGNDFTPVNFGGSVELDSPQVSGARPILNTLPGGTQAGVGVFGSKQNVGYAVTVYDDGGGNKYYIDGVKQDTVTGLIRGATYTFDTSDSTVSSHPFRFSTTTQEGGGSATLYSNGVAAITGAATTITVPHDAPNTLYYYCTSHSGMGADITGITTNEKLADQYASKCVFALPIVGNKEDVSASIACTMSNASITNSGVDFVSSYSNFYSGSGDFTGAATDVLSTGDEDTKFKMEEGDFTIECWVYSTSTSGTQNICQIIGDSGSKYYGIYYSSSALKFQMAGTGGAQADAGNVVFGKNRWYHIAMVRNGSTLKGYIDGVEAATAGSISSDMDETGYQAFVGRHSPTNNGFTGYIQDFRVYKGVAKYTSNFIPASTSPDILPDTPSGVSGGSKLAKVIDGAVAFDTDDYLSLADSDDFNLVSSGTGDFTIEFYVYLPDQSARYVLSSGTDSTRCYINGTSRLHLNNPTDSFLMESSTAAAAITANKWTHIAFCKSSSTGYIFVDGIQYSFHSGPALGGDLDFNDLRIGRTSNSLNGFISNLRVIKGTALYTSNFTPPTRTLTNVTNTKLLCCQSNTSANSAEVIPGTFSNSGTTYSSNLSGSIAGSPYDATKMFDGNISTFTDHNAQNTTITWTQTLTSVTSLRVYIHGGNSTNTVTTVGGNGTQTDTISTDFGPSWHNIVLGTTGSTINSIAFTRGGSGNFLSIYAVEVNGTVLIDNFYGKAIARAGDASATNFNPFNTDINTVRGQETGYATLNPLVSHSGTFSDGNLSFAGGSAAWCKSVGNFQIPSSGKYYFEGKITGSGAASHGIGLAEDVAGSTESDLTTGDDYYCVVNNTSTTVNKVSNGSATSLGSIGAFSAGDLFGVAIDGSTKEIWVHKNGIYFGGNTPSGTALLTGSGNLFPAIWGYNTSGNWDVNFGQKPFKFPPPAGFQPLNTANVRPETVIARPDQYVSTVLWTGNSTARSIVTNNAPDFVWTKLRNTGNNHKLFDSVRGIEKRLESSTTNGESTESGTLTSFNSDGFSLGTAGNVNGSYNYVAWCWKAGGSKNTFNVDDVGYASAAAAGLTAGDTTIAGASVGTKQGFSIIKYTGPNDTNNHEVPHGLSQAPDFIITKNLDATYNWDIYHSSLADDNYLIFTSAEIRNQGFSGRPTSTVFKTEHDYSTNENEDYIAYCWHDVPGLQKFGKYVGSNSTTFVELGFRPALLVIKFYDGTDVGSHAGWKVIDNQRNKFNISGIMQKVAWDVSEAENGGTTISTSEGKVDFLSNGFRILDNHAPFNTSGRNYIYAAWAEAPTVNLYGGQSNAR